MSRKARIRIVGMNSIGCVHADALKKVPEAEFVGACDVLPERLDAKAAVYGVKRKFTDYR